MQDMRCSPLSSAGCSFEYFIWLWGCTYFRCSFRVHFKQAPRQCLCHRKLSFHMRLTSPGEASRTEPSSFFDPFANSEDRRQSSGLWVLGFLSLSLHPPASFSFSFRHLRPVGCINVNANAGHTHRIPTT